MDNRWKSCLIDYLRAIHNPNTRTSYFKTLSRFFAAHEPEQVTRREIEVFIRTRYPDPHRSRQGELAAATQNARLAAIVSLYRYAATFVPEGETEPLWQRPLPTLGITRGKAEQSPKGLTLEELRRLFDQIDVTTSVGIRDRALLLFYLYSARRRSEIAELCYGDIQPATFQDEQGNAREGWLYRFRGKAHQEVLDSQELPQPVKDAIDWMLISDGRMDTIQADDPLFITDRKRGISATTIAKRMAHYACKAGLRASLHVLRHSSARIRFSEGSNIREIQHLLRHQHLSTTDRYLSILVGTEDPGSKLLEKKLLEEGFDFP